jgi:hypothetical protein
LVLDTGEYARRVRTISDLTYEPHRLIVALALGALALGAISGRVVRHWLLVGWTTFGALIAGIVLFSWLHNVGISGDMRLIMLAGLATAAAWLSGLLVVRAGALRVVGLTTLVPTLILGPVLWVRDTTPPLSANEVTRVFEKRFTLSHYRCYRAYNDGSVGLAKLEFQCDPSHPPSYCLHRVCGPRYWFGVDGQGRIGQWMLSAP